MPTQPPLDTLDAIAEISATILRAQGFTSASGAALLVREGGWLVCRVANATAAPDFGARIPLESSFYGLCVDSKKPQKCDDADTDLRVENALYGRVKPKSILAVPVREHDGAVVAVLAVFSTSASAFTNTHIAILRTMSDSLARPVQQLPSIGPVPPSVAAPPAPPVAAPKVSIPEPPRAVEPAKVVAPAPASVRQEISAPVAKPAVEPPPPPVKDFAKELLTLADDPRPTVVAPRVMTFTPPPSFDLPRPRRRDHTQRNRIAAVAAVAVLAVVFTTGWLKTRMPDAPNFSAAQPAVPAVFQQQVAAVEAAHPVPAATTPAKSASAIAAPAQSAPLTASAHTAEKASAGAEPAAPAAAEPVKTLPAALEPKPMPTHAPEIEAPEIALNVAPAMPAIAAPAAAAPTLHHSVTTPAKLTQRVAPEYPNSALRMRASGEVVLSAKVLRDGSVGDVKFVSGNPIFRDTAIKAVRQWRYQPATLDGRAIEAQADIMLRFAAPK